MYSILLKLYLLCKKYTIMINSLLLIITSWFIGYANIFLMKCWYCIAMTFLLLLRIPDFIEKKQHHYLFELCYYINILTIIIFICNYDISYIYPFLHGTFITYSLLMKDKFVYNDISKTTSLAIHSFSTIISFNVYWHYKIINMSVLTMKTYLYYLGISLLIYLGWLIPYSIYVYNYNGESITCVKYYNKLKTHEKVNLLHKIYYILVHMIAVFISVSIGIIMMHSYDLNKLLCGIQILSAIIYSNVDQNKLET